MSKLRNMARGQPCQVRLPGCNGGGDYTVLAHYRIAGYNGVGMKPPDILGAWACSKCHDLADFRAFLPNYTRAEIRLAHCEGVLRTVAELQKLGAVKC